jgi:hypothetical protein
MPDRMRKLAEGMDGATTAFTGFADAWTRTMSDPE